MMMFCCRGEKPPKRGGYACLYQLVRQVQSFVCNRIARLASECNQTIEPFLSEEDIKKGNRWSLQLSKELEGCKTGIIAATKKSIRSPWVLFEAGAIAKIIDQSAVIPILLDVTPADLVHHPFADFQYAKYGKEEVLSVLLAMNSGMADEGIQEDRLRIGFEKWWPDLIDEVGKQEVFEDEVVALPLSGVTNNAELDAKLDDLIQINQELSRLVSNPQRLLPPEYVQRILEQNPRNDSAA